MTTPKEHEVTGCRDCVFSEAEERRLKGRAFAVYYCGLDQALLPTEGDPPPVKCPLREGPIAVRLKPCS